MFTDHEVAKKQMKSFSGMISFEMKGGLEAGKTFIEVRFNHKDTIFNC